MRFAFALLFAYTVIFALMGADVYAELKVSKRGAYGLENVS